MPVGLSVRPRTPTFVPLVPVAQPRTPSTSVPVVDEARPTTPCAPASPRKPAPALLIVGVEGFSYAEAANVLGIPAGTLMSRIARGREELRGLLDDVARRRAIRVVEK